MQGNTVHVLYFNPSLSYPQHILHAKWRSTTLAVLTLARGGSLLTSFPCEASIAFILAAAAAAIALEGTLLAGSIALGAASCVETEASWLSAASPGSEGVMSHFERRFFLGGSSSLNNIHTHKKKQKEVKHDLKAVLQTSSLPHFLLLFDLSAHVFEYVGNFITFR